MDHKGLRDEFLKFFEKKGHKIVPSSSILPGDPSVLFTTAGMQQFKSYYLGEKSPYGPNVTSSQKCFRTSDIDEVGTNRRHLTFFEMMGNFSFGGYFKEEAIKLAFELLTKKYNLPLENLWITVFKGEEGVPEDVESQRIWKEIGINPEKINKFGRADNFWGPTGNEGPCGPNTEIHYDLTGKPCQKGKNCLPNCPCERFIEIWNLVFNEYFQDDKGNLIPLAQKGVDTGMGLERLVLVCQNKTSVFETDLFEPLITKIRQSQSIAGVHQLAERVIADHLKSSVFLISEGVFPSNVERGYILRRILRRAVRYANSLKLPPNFLIVLAQKIVEMYQDVYPEVKSSKIDILTVIQNEEEKFEKTLEKGLKEFKSEIEKAKSKEIPGNIVFDLYQSYGFPPDLTRELAKEKGFKIDEIGFQEEFRKHQEVSRAGVEKKFGGVGKEATEQAIKLHTTTHLLHAALRKVLGEKVKQMGSDITSQRLRFDFSFPRKLTEEEIEKIENLVNEKIKEDLAVKKEEMKLEKALKSGALSFFKEKYPETVSVYSINSFSKEICAGPHVKKTSQLGNFRIIKEESVGEGIRRLRGVLE